MLDSLRYDGMSEDLKVDVNKLDKTEKLISEEVKDISEDNALEII